MGEVLREKDRGSLGVRDDVVRACNLKGGTGVPRDAETKERDSEKGRPESLW